MMNEDPHSLTYKARTQIRGLANLVVDQTDSLVLTGWELYCLLQSVDDQLTEVLKNSGGDPDQTSKKVFVTRG
ncbi:hypothetical protein [Sedimenticola selenatireducens]|uniref:hypothetical protein n=1 Tax=Sedimenticola selenatireducens TaxID=191960 RepID=UPI002AAC222C|nr:hypothetical protein [Sedimenticola selenatireducens]